MPAIPDSTRSSITLRLLRHAREHWPQLDKTEVAFRAGFAYVTGVLPSGEQIPLFRLRYGGSAHSFGFAIYSHASERYENAVLLTGHLLGTPQEALDTACTLHLAALGHGPDSRPPKNLWSWPLSYGGGRSSGQQSLHAPVGAVSPRRVGADRRACAESGKTS